MARSPDLWLADLHFKNICFKFAKHHFSLVCLAKIKQSFCKKHGSSNSKKARVKRAAALRMEIKEALHAALRKDQEIREKGIAIYDVVNQFECSYYFAYKTLNQMVQEGVLYAFKEPGEQRIRYFLV